MVTVAAGTAALTHQADTRSALAREAELTKKLQKRTNPRSSANRRESRERRGSPISCRKRRNALIVREREGKSREEVLAKKLQECKTP